MPPSGPTTSTTSPASGSGTAASGAVAASCSTTASAAAAEPTDDVAGAGQSVDLGEPGPARLLGRLARGRAPSGERLVAARTVPPDHAPGRGPRHDHVGTDLGHRLDRELAALALGQRLHDHEPRLRRRVRRRRRRPRPRAGPRVGRGDRAARRRPGAVGDHEALADAEPLRPSRRAGPRGRRARRSRRLRSGDALEQEDAARSRGSVFVERVAQPGEEARALARATVPTSGPSSPRSAASLRSSSSCSGSSRVGVCTSTCTMQVAAPCAAQVRDAPARQGRRSGRTGCRPELDRASAVEGLERQRGAERRRRHRAR